MIHSAQHWDKLAGKAVQCQLCPALCKLEPDKYGICGCRVNRRGELVAENYGELVSVAIDPIEKKPLYHFYPGSLIFSIGANGCNLGCVHCQNWTISQEKVRTRNVSSTELVTLASEQNSIGAAFTYTEPTIWFEYVMDCAALLKQSGLKVVLVTNGYINPAPLDELIPFVDAMNIDLKGMQPEFYSRVCKGKLEPVLDVIGRVARSAVHLELTNLIIPGMNDSVKDIQELVEFIADLSDEIPLHFSAYHPDYKMDIPTTPVETILSAMEMAQKRLKYVYAGNVPLSEGRDTYCAKCKTLLIDRSGYRAKITGLETGKCVKCGIPSPVIL